VALYAILEELQNLVHDFFILLDLQHLLDGFLLFIVIVIRTHMHSPLSSLLLLGSLDLYGFDLPPDDEIEPLEDDLTLLVAGKEVVDCPLNSMVSAIQ
jgi:hypothetical protein